MDSDVAGDNGLLGRFYMGHYEPVIKSLSDFLYIVSKQRVQMEIVNFYVIFNGRLWAAMYLKDFILHKR